MPANSSTFIYSIHPNYKSIKQPLQLLMRVKVKSQKTYLQVNCFTRDEIDLIISSLTKHSHKHILKIIKSKSQQIIFLTELHIIQLFNAALYLYNKLFRILVYENTEEILGVMKENIKKFYFLV